MKDRVDSMHVEEHLIRGGCVGDESGSNELSSETPGCHYPDGEEPGGDEHGGDEPGGEEAGGEEPGSIERGEEECDGKE